MTTRKSAQNSGYAGEGEELFTGDLCITNMALGYQIPFKLIPSIKASLTKGLIIESKALAQTNSLSRNVNLFLVRGAQPKGAQRNHRSGSSST